MKDVQAAQAAADYWAKTLEECYIYQMLQERRLVNSWLSKLLLRIGGLFNTRERQQLINLRDWMTSLHAEVYTIALRQMPLNYEERILEVDYEPLRYLAEACKAARLPDEAVAVFPRKTLMVVSAYEIIVKEGYAAGFKTIWGTPDAMPMKSGK